jgi:hypothetical protein
MRIIRILACLPLLATLGGCLTENPFAEYFHRTDTITMDAGNSQNVNIATQTVDPWPRNVGNRRIPADAERMAAAVQKTHRPSQQGGAGAGGAAGGGAAGAGAAGGTGTGTGTGAGTGTTTGATGGTATGQ